MFIVKRNGHEESFDERKLYASVYSATFNCHNSEEYAEEIAQKVTDKIISEIKNNVNISSRKIRIRVEEELKSIDRDVTVMYKLNTASL